MIVASWCACQKLPICFWGLIYKWLNSKYMTGIEEFLPFALSLMCHFFGVDVRDALDVDVIFTLKAKSISHKTHITALRNDVYLLLLTLHWTGGKIARQICSVWDIVLSLPFIGMLFIYTGLHCWKQIVIS